MIQWIIDIYEANAPWVLPIYGVAKAISIIVHCIAIVFFSRLIGNLCYRKIELSCGSFKVKRKHFDVQNVTNIVSLYFYDGGQVPAEIRKEILLKTTPQIKDLQKL